MQIPAVQGWTPGDWTLETPLDGVEAHCGYAVCSLPRTGSTLLCDLLRSTGKLGRPHEYLSAFTMRDWGASDYPEGVDQQVEEIKRRGVSENGVFGFKLFPHQLARIGHDRWLKQLPCLHFIHLQRPDLLGSALSLVHAQQTNSFTVAARLTGVAHYDPVAIADKLDWLLNEQSLLLRYFAVSGIRPLQINYDDLVREPQREIDKVARLLGIDPVRIDPAKLGVTRQSEPEKAEWRERFLAEQAKIGVVKGPRSAARLRLDQRLRRIGGMISGRG